MLFYRLMAARRIEERAQRLADAGAPFADGQKVQQLIDTLQAQARKLRRTEKSP